jgi:hypothetical protein
VTADSELIDLAELRAELGDEIAEEAWRDGLFRWGPASRLCADRREVADWLAMREQQMDNLTAWYERWHDA